MVFDCDAGLQGFNLFPYCGSNPINRIDISGTDSVSMDDATDDILDAKALEGGSSTMGRSFNNVSTPMDTGYRYGVDFSQAKNSSSFSGGLLSNGYISYNYHTNPDNTGVRRTPQNNNPLMTITYTDKVILQNQMDDLHGFSLLVDNYGSLGHITQVVGGDGNTYTKLIIPGAYKTFNGHFEYMWDSRGICNHRMFVKK